jgi:hypothetical protein
VSRAGVLVLLMSTSCKKAEPVSPAPIAMATLTEGLQVEGFEVEALYVDGRDHPVGARLRHQHSGMSVRLFRWDSVPQSYLWVNTVPDSDRGEPHTQEHLLLGKGNQGRAVATLEEMSLVQSSAFTEQHRTVYHFSTTAGPEVFFDVFEARLHAMLAPDYLDEEIRREVHHWGVIETPTGLQLEEKGTVYNEMDSSMQQPGWVLWSQVPKDLYGPGHPQAFESGGKPDALRELTPAHIRSFHAAKYQLANMGALVFLPEQVPLVEALDKLDNTLVKLQPTPTAAGVTFPTEDTLPAPAPVADRSVRELRYPHQDGSGPATVLVAWPPGRDMPLRERLLMSLLLSGIAGAENSNLYKALIDSRTRERELDATSVYAWMGSERGRPVYMQVSGLSPTALGEDEVSWLVSRLRQELTELAAKPPGDPGLVDLQRRLQAGLVAWRRAMRDSMTGPPGFGARGQGSGWHDHLVDLDTDGGFRRALLLDPQLAWVQGEIDRTDNPWTEYLARWQMLEVEPFVYVNRPDRAALDALATAKDARVAAKRAALAAELGTKEHDEQAALAAFQAQYDQATVELEAATQAPQTRFLSSPPLTADPELRWEQQELSGVPLVVGHFDALLGAKLGLALDLGGTDPAHWGWMRILPRLLTDVGVLQDGVPLSNDEVIERLQLEVLDASASTSTNSVTGRAELLMTASGTDPEETRKAIGWARTFLTTPDWRPENLPRIRDVVDEALDSARLRMQGSEESWSSNPPSAWEHQDQELQLHIWSFLTYEHDLLRLRYRLMQPEEAASQQLHELADAADKLDRKGLLALVTRLQGQKADLPKAARAYVSEPVPKALAEAAGDLEKSLGALPDSSLKQDWAYLCHRMADDLAEPPERALAELDALRSSMLSRGGARMYAAGGALLDKDAQGALPLQPDLDAWLSVLREGEPGKPARASQPLRARVAARGGQGDAVHVGLYEPNRRSGIVSVSAPLHTLTEIDESSLLDDLAVRTLGGGGAHSLFIRTWGAGLAYSNGSSAREASGRMQWSAERCPKLQQTTSFVIDAIQSTPIDEDIGEYAIATVFWSRADGSPEDRTWGIARDLADGETPEVIRAFREAILSQRGRPELPQQLAERVPQVYGRLLPGFGPPTAEIDGALSFVIGDQSQLDAWRTWLHEVEGDKATFEVLYPRDFWLVPTAATVKGR